MPDLSPNINTSLGYEALSTDSSLYQKIVGSIKEEGFMQAWQKHFSEIAQEHKSSDLLGRSLFSLMTEDPELKEYFETLPLEQKNFLEGSLQSGRGSSNKWESHSHRDFVDALYELFTDHSVDFLEVTESDGNAVKCLTNEPFKNWGRTVENVPYLTFFPTTKLGVCNIVKWATQNSKTVRVAGYRHTWSDLYSANSQVLISFLPLDVVNNLPALEPPIDPENQLQGIRIVGTIDEDGTTKALCKVGAATTNEQFRRWCLDENGGQWKWTVPLNVIMVEITWGGSNSPICHGAGLRNQTLSDLVTEIEFVNAKGELQTVNSPQQIRAAAGCFGLLGVVTSLTLKLDPMSYAVMQPVKPRLALTIPPPEDFDIPADIDMSGISDQDLKDAWMNFVERCENDYYSEWFWFPYHNKCWVNTWNNDGKRDDAKIYPSEIDTIIQQAEEYLGELINNTVFKHLPGRKQAELLAWGAMSALPENSTHVTSLIDALHFRRGIQNMRVLDMEFEIPIPAHPDDPSKPDWTVCQKAWWTVISNIYKRKDAPMRVTLEMRIMGDSKIIMAPQFGNSYGTCSIEVLTNLNVPSEEWLEFMQEVVDLWDACTDSAGNKLNIRPHWAKQWQNLKLRGMSINKYLKEIAYKERIHEFKACLQEIAIEGGYSLHDLQSMFSNQTLNDLFEEVFR